MKIRKRIKKIFLFIIVNLCLISLYPAKIKAAGVFKLSIANNNYTLSALSGEFSTFNEAMQALSENDNENVVIVNEANKIIAMKKGMIIFNGSATITFTSKLNGQSVYVRNNISGYYNSTVDENTVKASISGFTGNVTISKVLLIPDAWISGGTTKDRYFFDYYTRSSSGDLLHYLSYYDATNKKNTSASLTVDKAPSFITSGNRFYSFNGVDFYKNPYDVFDPKVSPIGIFYPYFKFLSFRSKTSYTANEINKYISAVSNKNSILLNQGSAFIKAQNDWGVNAIMELAFANLESAYGSSSIAIGKNNLFGINATDTNPAGASTYLNAADCINQHAKYLLNQGYFDAYAFIDATIKKNNPSFYDSGYINSYVGDSRYSGSSPGSKAGGVNGKYASDPFHGEKIGGLSYLADKYLGSKDYNRYQIGITKVPAYAYVLPDENSWKLYQYTTNSTRGKTTAGPLGMSVVILGTVGDFYMIQSEMPLKQERAYFAWKYDFDTSVAFVKKSDIQLLNNGPLSLVALLETIEICVIEERGLYTTSSLLIYDEAYQQALDMVDKAGKTQVEVDAACTKLFEAFSNLEKVVIDKPVTSIVLDYSDTILQDLTPFTVIAEIQPSDATIKKIKFTSSNTSVATVNQEGRVTPLKNGNTIISATAIDGSGTSTSFELTIALLQIESETYQILNDDGVLKGVVKETSLNSFLANLATAATGGYINVTNEGHAVEGGIIKTGMQVKLTVDGVIVQTLDIAVRGDIDGDGTVDIVDYILLRNHLLNVKSLPGIYWHAADLNSDGMVDITDYVLLRNLLIK